MDDANPNAGHRNRLRQRFLRAGAGAFADHELLELLLTFAIPRKDTKPLAKKLLAKFGSLHEVLNAPASRLASIEGMGPQSAALIRLTRELHRPSITPSGKSRPVVSSTATAVVLFREELASATEENFVAMLLDVSSRLLRIVTLAEGTIDRATVYPRRLVEEILKIGAAAVIVGHNHPRSSEVPSKEDHQITQQLYSALAPLGIDFLDHIILGEKGYYSFASHGELQTSGNIKKPQNVSTEGDIT